MSAICYKSVCHGAYKVCQRDGVIDTSTHTDSDCVVGVRVMCHGDGVVVTQLAKWCDKELCVSGVRARGTGLLTTPPISVTVNWEVFFYATRSPGKK